MWNVANCSPRASSGETSATASRATPPYQSASRPYPAARAPPSARDVRQRSV